MGGFGQSESLSAHLRDTLAEECALEGLNVVLDSSKLQWVEIGGCFVSIYFTNRSCQQIDRCCMWSRHSCTPERRRTCTHPGVQLRIFADRALRHAGGSCKSETEDR